MISLRCSRFHRNPHPIRSFFLAGESRVSVFRYPLHYRKHRLTDVSWKARKKGLAGKKIARKACPRSSHYSYSHECVYVCDFASWQWYWRAVGRKLARVAFTREPLPYRDTLYPVLPGSFVLDNFVRARDWKEEKEEFNWTGNTNRSGLFRRLSEINNDGENNILPRYLIESIVFDKMELQGSARLEQSCN